MNFRQQIETMPPHQRRQFLARANYDLSSLHKRLKQTGKNFQMNQVKQHLSSLLIKHFSSEELVEYENHT